MIRTMIFAVASLIAVAAAPASAGKLVATPIKGLDQTIRFEQGVPTIEDDKPQAGVRVVPIPGMDHGSLQFNVVVFNKSGAPINIGSENISLRHGGMTLACFTKDELAKKAKNRAMWSQIGYAMLAGAAAASQNNDTTITTMTPRGGIYRTVIQRPGLSNGQLATVAAGGGAIALSQIGLQKTLEALDGQIIQTTTLDPQMGYGGRVVVQKLQKAKAGDTIVLDVDVGGEHHLFDFTLVKA